MSKKNPTKVVFLDPSADEKDLEKVSSGELLGSPLIKSIVSAVRKQEHINRLAFEEDPNLTKRFGGLFYDKVAQIPDRVLKRISVVDDLVADCIMIRSQQMSTFGRPLVDRHSTGFRIEPDPFIFKQMSKEEQSRILKRIKEITKLMVSCGHNDNLKPEELMSLSKFLYLSARNAVIFGRFATEIVSEYDLKEKKKKFKYFRPVDSGTIYRAIPRSTSLDKLREQALKALKALKGENKDRIDPDRFNKDEYTWVQVIEGTPWQAFTSDEMFVHDCYPTTDIELNGYPLTPIDMAMAAITTHINITTWNKLYFSQGRASRGMLVIQSDDIDPQTLADLKQQFQAQINDVGKAWRMPLMRVSVQDKVTWQPIDNSNRDMEFQYLYEMNCRVLMAAFQISPDEVPSYGHLAKATNSQALNDSTNIEKLEASRDVGIRPLLSHFQDFLNSRILPLLDEELAKICTVRLYGLDSKNQQQENEQLANEMEISLTYDDVMRIKEKEPLGKRWGGEYPLSSAIQMIHDKALTMGEIREHFFGIEGSAKDPNWHYVRDTFWLQNQQNLMAQKQMEETKKLTEEAAQEAPKDSQNNQSAQPSSESQSKPPGQNVDSNSQKSMQPDDLSQNIDQLINAFSKSESDFKVIKSKWISHHKVVVEEALKEFNKESEKALGEISDLTIKNNR